MEGIIRLSKQPMFVVNGQFPGMLSSGNVDLANRPQVKNPDGSISTVRSITISADGKHFVLPTIGPNGENWSNQEAIDNWKKTKQHLGVFDSIEAAEEYAQKLHEQQAEMYLNKGK